MTHNESYYKVTSIQFHILIFQLFFSAVVSLYIGFENTFNISKGLLNLGNMAGVSQDAASLVFLRLRLLVTYRRKSSNYIIVKNYTVHCIYSISEIQ